MAWYEPTKMSEYLDKLENPSTPEWELVKKLNTNDTAFVVRDTANGITCLQSYSTIVSMQAGAEDIRLGRWSVTTSKHQGMFGVWCMNHPAQH